MKTSRTSGSTESSHPQASSQGVDDLLRGLAPGDLPSLTCELLEMSSLPSISVVEIAECVRRDDALMRKLIRFANTVQHGAGIPVTTIEAAIMRVGSDRIQALSMLFEVVEIVTRVVDKRVDLDGYWQTCLIRGCFARALGQATQPTVSAAAMIVGFLQDIGVPLMMANAPEAYETIHEEGGGCCMREAVLEWQTFKYDHIHVATQLLERWHMPRLVVDAIGRHHTRPPATPAFDTPLRLWQIGHAASVLPIVSRMEDSLYGGSLPTLLQSAFNMQPEDTFDVLRQAMISLDDMKYLFEPIFQISKPAAELFGPAANLLCGEAELPQAKATSARRDRTPTMPLPQTRSRLSRAAAMHGSGAVHDHHGGE